MMPGPLLTVTIANSAQKGFLEGPLLVLGHGILELVLVIAIVAGMSPILKSPIFLFIVTLFGGGMLIYMGFYMIKNAKGLSLDQLKNKTKARNTSSILSGILVSLANPYWILWWATIGLGYLLTSLKFGIQGVIIFFIGHILADLAWYSLVSLGVSKGKKLIKDRTYQLIIQCCGVILIGFGGWFLYGIKNFI